MMNSFTPRAQHAIALARTEAVRMRHNYVGPEHLFLGILKDCKGFIPLLFPFDYRMARESIEKENGLGPEDSPVVDCAPYTPRIKKVFSLAMKAAKALNHSYVGMEHLFLGLLDEGDGVAMQFIKTRCDPKELRTEILWSLGSREPEAEKNNTLAGRFETILTTLQACRDKFRDYENLHLAKTPPDFEKARVNCMMAELCEDALKS